MGNHDFLCINVGFPIGNPIFLFNKAGFPIGNQTLFKQIGFPIRKKIPQFQKS